ncbi:hypothetical protein TNCV_4896441 [Trichonephila clavipes]|uniref:Uncharacterized protein n=1 Tax=Trichonephila clavipes TaxID=2585209 RepID=A0A8X6VWP1_TRICX|nr:hypothetical protein TNCV_4896441 [Trichonephila clavipes]
MPSIIDSHDMGLRTVYSPDARKKTPIQRLFNHRQVMWGHLSWNPFTTSLHITAMYRWLAWADLTCISPSA